LFLLMQITMGLSNPWGEYCRMLPRIIPLPTMWTEQERMMLQGTSLEVRQNFIDFLNSVQSSCNPSRESKASISFCNIVPDLMYWITS
jgi:hypothetical protein